MSLKKEIGIKVGKKVVEGVKKYTGAALRGLGLSGKSRTASGLKHPVIDRLKVGKKLKQKRDVQDNIVSDKDKVMKNLNTENKLGVRTKVPLKKSNKEVSDILDKK